MDKLTMTIKELAEQLNISKPNAYRLARTDGFPALIIGKRILIPVDRFKRWLDESTNK